MGNTVIPQGTPWLLWAHLMLFWMLSHYLILDKRPLGSIARSTLDDLNNLLMTVALTAAFALIVLWVSAAPSIAATFAVSSAVLCIARNLNPHWRLWERELLVTGSFAVLSAGVVQFQSAEIKRAAFDLGIVNGRTEVACLVAALFIFTIHGGTYVVRGILSDSRRYGTRCNRTKTRAVDWRS